MLGAMGASAPPPPPTSLGSRLVVSTDKDKDKRQKEIVFHVFRLFKDSMVLWVEGSLFVDLYDIF